MFALLVASKLDLDGPATPAEVATEVHWDHHAASHGITMVRLTDRSHFWMLCTELITRVKCQENESIYTKLEASVPGLIQRYFSCQHANARVYKGPAVASQGADCSAIPGRFFHL